MNLQISRLNAPSLIFVGHISVDEVENANGKRTQPGGGALYSAIAARALNETPAIVSTIGKDFSFTSCFEGLDSTCIRQSKNLTSRFHIRYNKNWEANYLEALERASAKISPSQIPQNLLNPQNIIHLSPMKPALTLRIVNYIRQRSPQVKISASTWIGYTKTSRNRRLLKKLASQVNFFMLNEFEAKTLAQTDSLITTLERLQAQKMIVTMGKLGAIVSGDDIDPQMIPALNVPTDKVVDTTGAGDTWNGAFLATYKTTSNLMQSVIVASIISSIKCSKWGFQAIQDLSFKTPREVVEHILALKEGGIQKKITHYSH